MWTTPELAEAAGVDPSTIRRLLAKGALRGKKLGRDWLIEPEEARRYLQQRGMILQNAKTATPQASQSEKA